MSECFTELLWYDIAAVCRGTDKSLTFPVSPMFMSILMPLSHESLLFCVCLT
jgi:hypothetical protein